MTREQAAATVARVGLPGFQGQTPDTQAMSLIWTSTDRLDTSKPPRLSWQIPMVGGHAELVIDAQTGAVLSSAMAK
jgi:hypothetical protein